MFTLLVCLLSLSLGALLSYVALSPDSYLVRARLLSSKVQVQASDGTVVGTIEAAPDGRMLVKYVWGAKEGQHVMINMAKVLESYYLENKDKYSINPKEPTLCDMRNKVRTAPKIPENTTDATILKFPDPKGGKDE